MLRFIGFQAKSGTITDEKTGEVRPWSNRFIRCVSDKHADSSEYGLVPVENKIRTALLASSLGITFKDSEVGSPSFEASVNDALKSFFDKEIEFTVDIVKGQAEVTGLRAIPAPLKKP